MADRCWSRLGSMGYQLGKRVEVALMGFELVIPVLVQISRLQGEIIRFVLSWVYLTMVLLKHCLKLDGLLSTVKIDDLILTGWIMAMMARARARAVSLLEALFLESLSHSPYAALLVYETEG